MLHLEKTTKNDPRLLDLMNIHYSRPKGFVGRCLCYAVLFNKDYYGYIVGGSAILLSKCRDQFFDIKARSELRHYINNIFYHVSPINGKYPCRNFTSKVVEEWEKVVQQDWLIRYGDEVKGFETLVEPPRSGDLYKKVGYRLIGQTVGYRLRRPKGKKIYDTSDLYPKLIFCKKV